MIHTNFGDPLNQERDQALIEFFDIILSFKCEDDWIRICQDHHERMFDEDNVKNVLEPMRYNRERYKELNDKWEFHVESYFLEGLRSVEEIRDILLSVKK